ncbi:VRR-NUC domain-containing protein [Undibacterium sp. Ren11W]|uniref:VRR-NUC domain-containing protein n=1 Tax=Undibacterium sp. Ren11W TaxID=3413045 RepID=UPI003BF17EA7
MNRVLPNPLYYLDNFQLVLDWVRERYDDLLIPEEHCFINDFFSLPQASRALFVRMVMRKGDYFRESKLSYAEIADTSEAISSLIKGGWIVPDPPLSLDQLFELLQKPEIVAAFSLTAADKNLKKAEQLDCLRSRFDGSKPFSAWHPASVDRVLHIQNKPMCDRLRLIFFGNWYQDWSEFVLSDLGIYQYEVIPFSKESRGFQTRRDVESYIAVQVCRELFDKGEPTALVLAELAKIVNDNDWINGRRHKLLFQMGQQCEKQKDWDQALMIYRMSNYPGSRLRTIRVLEKTEQQVAALELLNLALMAPENDAEYQQLQRSAPRLNRKLGHINQALPTMAQVTSFELTLPYPDSSFYVEAVVKDHLSQDDAPVYYVENTLINSMFGLLCWPAIFKPVPGAFFHPFHRGPVDLTSADFHQRRKDEFAICMEQLDSDDYLVTIRETYQTKQGIQSPFVFWNNLDADLLDLALRCIPAQHLRLWFQRILSNIKSNRNGFPDLIQFWPQERRYSMIEVKGPGDRLQDNQKRLIDFCALHELPISVCYLEWREDDK